MSPANPSGTMIGRKALAELGETCRRLGLWFVSDEIYHGLTYAEPASTALASDDDAVVINSFSKYYCMTGWRVGWMVRARSASCGPIERLAQNLYISPPYLSQVAALAAFDATEELEAVKAGYAAQPRLLLEELPRHRHRRDAPRRRRLLHLCRHRPLHERFHRLLQAHAGRGRRRGDARARFRSAIEGAHYLRLSFAGSESDCREAVRAAEGWLKEAELLPSSRLRS